MANNGESNEKKFEQMAEGIAREGCANCVHKAMAESVKGMLREMGFCDELESGHQEAVLNHASHYVMHRGGQFQANLKRFLEPSNLTFLNVFAVGLVRVASQPNGGGEQKAGTGVYL
jgi:hypothetical protein